MPLNRSRVKGAGVGRGAWAPSRCAQSDGYTMRSATSGIFQLYRDVLNVSARAALHVFLGVSN